MTTTPQKPPRFLAAIVAAICTIGLGISIELTRIHVFTHTDPEFQSICGISDKVNCETVALSPYSVFMNIPVSVWGMIGYVVMLGFALAGLFSKRKSAWPWGFLLGLFCISAAVSITMATIAVLLIDSVCLFCMTTYALNFILLALGICTYKKYKLSLFPQIIDDFKTLFTNRIIGTLVIVAGLSTVAGTALLITPYWGAPGWAGLLLQNRGENEGGHWIGKKGAKIVIDEYSDYECPHCRKAHRTMRQFVAEHPDDVYFVHHHMPLDQACNPSIQREFHQRACEFSYATECANAQGKFWELNDAIFSMQDNVKAKSLDLKEISIRLGLDRERFLACLDAINNDKAQGQAKADAEKAKAAIEKDLKDSKALKIRGTPTFNINGQLYSGIIPPEVLDAALRGEPIPPQQK